MIGARFPSGAPSMLSYEAWVVRFEEVSLQDLLKCSPGSEHPPATGTFVDARDLMLYLLKLACLFDGPPEPVENPQLPAQIAEVHAELESALLLTRNLFSALFATEIKATVYAAATERLV